jgi:hypothetical protein
MPLHFYALPYLHHVCGRSRLDGNTDKMNSGVYLPEPAFLIRSLPPPSAIFDLCLAMTPDGAPAEVVH